MNCLSASSRRLNTRSSASSRSSSEISEYGVMWLGLTIARSRPADDAVVQKHGVEHRTGSGRDAEEHVGDSQRCLYVRDLGLDAPDALDRLYGRGPPLLVACRQREGQA